MIDVSRDTDGKILSIKMLTTSNFHAHFRRDAMMRAVAPDIMRGQRYVLVMPNTGPILTMHEALKYWNELDDIAKTNNFNFLELIMTLYFSRELTPQVVEEISRSDTVRAVKYYPPEPGATTGSGHGVSWEDNPQALWAMERLGVPLLGHFESTHDKDNRLLPHEKREGYFVTNHLPRIRDKYPDLRICCEHATTEATVNFIKQDRSGKTVLTATPQALLFARKGGAFPDYSWRNHLKCMPIVKDPKDRDAVLEFVTSGDFRAIAGDDTAPHLLEAKNRPFDDCASGCWLPHATALYALAFERARALDERFVNFMSLNGPKWWGLALPHPNDTITLLRETVRDIPDPLPVPELNDVVVPLGWTMDADRYHVGLAKVPMF